MNLPTTEQLAHLAGLIASGNSKATAEDCVTFALELWDEAEDRLSDIRSEISREHVEEPTGFGPEPET